MGILGSGDSELTVEAWKVERPGLGCLILTTSHRDEACAACGPVSLENKAAWLKPRTQVPRALDPPSPDLCSQFFLYMGLFFTLQWLLFVVQTFDSRI